MVAAQCYATHSMTTCLGRRAHPDKFSFPLSKDGKTKNFVWTEYRCPNEVPEGIKTCVECSIKINKYKYQAAPKCDHGLIGGPYPSGSKLYGSPYYLELIKSGWVISEADENRAKEALDKAISDMGRKKAVDTSVDKPTATFENLINQTPTKPVVTVVTAKPRKPRTVKPKSVIPAVTAVTDITEAPPVENITQEPIILESNCAPIIASETLVVKVTKVRHQGKDYYFDSLSGKLYDKTSAGVGSYKGRYNAEKDELNTQYPDSDVEV